MAHLGIRKKIGDEEVEMIKQQKGREDVVREGEEVLYAGVYVEGGNLTPS